MEGPERDVSEEFKESYQKGYQEGYQKSCERLNNIVRKTF